MRKNLVIVVMSLLVVLGVSIFGDYLLGKPPAYGGYTLLLAAIFLIGLRLQLTRKEVRKKKKIKKKVLTKKAVKPVIAVAETEKVGRTEAQWVGRLNAQEDIG